MDDTEEAMVTSADESSIGEAVSGRGENVSNEDDEIYYIPERRPSLDLGTTPMDTSNWHFVEPALSPAQSYRSMTSDCNRDEVEDEDGLATRVRLNRADSYSSCYSFDSDDCEKRTPKDINKDDVSEPSDMPELTQVNPSEVKWHPALTVAFTFKVISNTLGKLSQGDLARFKRMLWKNYPKSFNTSPQSMDMVNLVDRLLECYNLQVSLEITKNLLGEMGLKNMVDDLQSACLRNEVRHDLCEILRKKYIDICDDLEGERRPFNDVFAHFGISSVGNHGPNIEHEVMTIEKLHTNKNTVKQISTVDILSAESLEQSHVKLVLLTGVTGSGKSMLVRKLVLDWIEGRSHQHVSFLFPLSFRELKQFEASVVSLIEIIEKLYPPTKRLSHEEYKSQECTMMFIFDGLDEYSGNLDFFNTVIHVNPSEPTTLNILVVNLLREKLYFRALFLVTTRPPVTNCIPWDTKHHEIELRGFSDPEKDEYFKKRFKEADQAARVIAYVSSFKTFRIMCHLPLFCSLVADECQRLFSEQGTQAELPRSITYMYTKLLLTLMRERRKYRAPDRTPDQERDFLMKLGQLAFNMQEQGEFKISKSDWTDLGISDREAVVNSGLCTEYFTNPFVLTHEVVLSFIHPTMQEYLAALYVFLSFRNQGKNVFELQRKDKFKGMFKGHKDTDIYKSAVDKSLQCEDGKLDIFLRFLFGMLLKINMELLQCFFTSSLKWQTSIQDVTALIRKKIRDNQYPNRSSNLQHCLEELGVGASSSV